MLSGSIVALVTPFNASGEIDFSALEALIEWHIEEGTDGLVLAGSTGEGSSLSWDEKCAIFAKAVEVTKKRIPLIAGTGSNQTKESVALTLEAKKIGIDAALVIVPYYSRPTEEGCFQHFSEIAKVDLPMLLYHHPGRTGTKLSVEAIKRICALPQVVGIKDASEDMNLMTEILKETDIPLFSGIDTLCHPLFSLGCAGSISIIGNVVPKQWKEFIDTAMNGDPLEAREKFFAVYDLCEVVVLETNPQCVKYAVSVLGKCSPKMRLPLIEPSFKNQEKVKASVNEWANLSV